MKIDAYIVEIVDRHYSVLWEAGESNVTQSHKYLVNKCLSNKTIPNIGIHIWLPDCLQAFDRNLSGAWRLILTKAFEHEFNLASTNDNLDFYSYSGTLEELLNNKISSETRLVSRVWTLALYSLFLRRFRVYTAKKFPTNDFVFDIVDAIRQILGREPSNSPDRDKVEWLAANYCCYTALSVYPLLIWYATTLGTELPPGTIRSYQPTIERRNPSRIYIQEPEFMPVLRTRLSDYGWRDWDVLERNSRMLDLDSTLLAMAIDIFYGRFLTSPWIRSSILSSFINTMVRLVSNKNNVTNYLVLPVLIPMKLIHPQSNVIPVPLVVSRSISPRVKDDLKDLMQRLSQQAITTSLAIETANLLSSVVRNEMLQDENNISRRLEPLIHNLDSSSCVEAIIVEPMHPIAGYYLIQSVAGRSIAYVPSPALAINVLHLLMNRLMKADYIETNIYIVIRTCPLIQDYLYFINKLKTVDSDIARSHHPLFYNEKNDKKIYSINIERIAKVLLRLQDFNLNHNKMKKLKCINEINNINEKIINLIW